MGLQRAKTILNFLEQDGGDNIGGDGGGIDSGGGGIMHSLKMN